MKKVQLLFMILLVYGVAVAQQDKITFNNNDVVVGEIKGMSQGVLSIETDYSDSDFTINWEEINTITAETFFLITLSDGRRINGTISSVGKNQLNIISEEDGTIAVTFADIVFMDSVDKGFWSQAYASVDFGFDMTKANNLRQMSARSNLGYRAETWSTNMFYNAINTSQDSINAIKRNDAGIDFKYYFQRKWFSVASVNFFSNTEQKIDLRTNGKLGFGTYIIQTNHAYWNFSCGASFNVERYKESTEDRDSWEGYLATELNMFDTGDLSLNSKFGAYPGITEKGRWRYDFNFDVKYDLPRDFYIKTGLTYNFDNKPVTGASKDDYVFYTGFGWEL